VRVLLTGGSGFIGSHLAERLLGRGDQVVSIDNLSTGNLGNISEILEDENFTHHTADLLSEDGMELLKREVKDADVIFHLAAAVGVFNVVNFPAETIKNNIEITEALLRFAKSTSSKVVIFSTSEVYGKSADFPYNEDQDIVLGPSKNSRWSYASSKLVDEFLGLAYYNQHNLPVIVVRLFNTVGPRQVGHYGMVIPRFVEQAANNLPITVYGDGKQSRCFCNVEDTIEALLGLIDDENCVGEVFNIGSSQEISIGDLAIKIKQITNSESEITFTPYEEAYSSGFEDMLRRVPDTSKINRFIGWDATIGLEETIRRVWAQIEQG
tara:strand:- start:1667 stop:2638 length:972 start_codon:yes stop_codon:yes gene_type:complete